MRTAYEITYDNYGINGDNTEGETIVVLVIAKSIEKAIQKFRASLPKSLEYTILVVELDLAEVIG